MNDAIGTENAGVVLIAQKPYSAHPEDAHLSVVGGVWLDGRCEWRAVTWIRNTNNDGDAFCFEGDYAFPSASRVEALQKMATSFNARGLQSGSRLFVMPDAK